MKQKALDLKPRDKEEMNGHGETSNFVSYCFVSVERVIVELIILICGYHNSPVFSGESDWEYEYESKWVFPSVPNIRYWSRSYTYPNDGGELGLLTVLTATTNTIICHPEIKPIININVCPHF